MTIEITEKKAPRRRLAPARERVVPGQPTSVDKNKLVRLAVERVLRSSDYNAVRKVRSFVEDGVVMLFGTVSSYYLKQIVQTAVMKLELAVRVENHCEVEYPSHRNGSIHQPFVAVQGSTRATIDAQ